jgi:AraC-like DNA-binding protein
MPPEASDTTTGNDPRFTVASIDPLTLRYLVRLMKDRGADPHGLCRGLGFAIADLDDPDFKISYRQASLMIRRAERALREPGLGLAVGSRQTPVSWGLVGFGMMACATLGEAIALGLRYQKDAGSLADIQFEAGSKQVALLADLVFHDPEIEIFLIEEMFAGMLSTARFLVGPQFTPVAIEVIYDAPAHAGAYQELFRCPVRFKRRRNRLVVDAAWVAQPLVTHDASVERSVRELIERGAHARREKADFLSTVERAIRENLAQLPPLAEIAADIHMSERTLRRKLDASGFSYLRLLEAVRKSRALELLSHSDCTVADVAASVGFADVRNFRKAFKRWTGVAPGDIRAQDRSSTAMADTDGTRRA